MDDLEGSSWTTQLPSCPCELPSNTDLDDGWAIDAGNIEYYHPGSTVCIRSYPAIETDQGWSGQQCCYDENGKLITAGAGEGTPDRSSTCTGEDDQGRMKVSYWGAYLHYFKDVRTFEELGWEEYNKIWKPSRPDCD